MRTRIVGSVSLKAMTGGLLAAREPGTGQLVAACFNTMSTSRGIPTTRDTARQALVEGLEPKGYTVR